MTGARAPSADATVLVLQHTAVEGPGRLGEALSRRGVSSRVVRAGEGEPVPRDLAGARGLVLLGGPMGVHEDARHPFLRDELALLEGALRADVAVLGICLGSQLLAAALGARVTRAGRLEIGWLPVTLRPEARADRLFARLPPVFDALHWHGDAFALPRGAVPLASSAMTAHQAFSWNDRAWGTLFHLEATAAQARAMAAAFPDDVAHADGGAAELAADTRASTAEPLASALFEAWIAALPR